MNSYMHKTIVNNKLALFTLNDEVDERQVRFFFINNWKTLTQGLENSTILFRLFQR